MGLRFMNTCRDGLWTWYKEGLTEEVAACLRKRRDIQEVLLSRILRTSFQGAALGHCEMQFRWCYHDLRPWFIFWVPRKAELFRSWFEPHAHPRTRPYTQMLATVTIQPLSAIVQNFQKKLSHNDLSLFVITMIFWKRKFSRIKFRKQIAQPTILLRF